MKNLKIFERKSNKFFISYDSNYVYVVDSTGQKVPGSNLISLTDGTPCAGIALEVVEYFDLDLDLDTLSEKDCLKILTELFKSTISLLDR